MIPLFANIIFLFCLWYQGLSNRQTFYAYVYLFPVEIAKKILIDIAENKTREKILCLVSSCQAWLLGWYYIEMNVELQTHFV